MKKTIMVIAVIFVALAANVFASEYEIIHSFADRNNVTDFGSIKLLDIILNKNLINRNTVVLNYTPQVIYQYDAVMVASNAVTLDGVTYSPGQSKSYDDLGVHTYCELSNTTHCSSFTVATLPTPIVNISVESKELDLKVNSSRVSLDSEKIVKIYFNATKDLTPRTYTYNLNINNETYEQTFTIEKIERWHMINKTFIDVIDTGEYGTLGVIWLESTGNTYTVLNVSIDNNDSMLYVDNDILLYPNTPVKLEVLYDISKGRSVGMYKTRIFLGNETLDLNYSIRDNVNPEISDFNVTNVTIYNQTGFSFYAKDNLRLNNTYIEYMSVDTAQIIKANVSKFENDLFLDDKTTFDYLGDYTAQACVDDDSGNQNCTDKVFFKVVKTDRIKVPSQTIHFKKSKFGDYTYATLFTITEGISVRISLQNLEYVNKSDQWSIKIIDGDGSTEYFLEQNKEVVVTKAGDIQIGFKGDIEKIYNGILDIHPPWFNVNISQITFTGEVVDYQVPEPFSRDWYGNNFSCEVIDTGDIDTSMYDCNIKFSILSDLENTAIPITPADKEANSASWEDRIQVWKDKNASKIGVIIMFIILLIVMIGFIIYLALFADRLNLKFV